MREPDWKTVLAAQEDLPRHLYDGRNLEDRIARYAAVFAEDHARMVLGRVLKRVTGLESAEDIRAVLVSEMGD